MITASHAEMLSILNDHPDGLITAEILKVADKNPKSLIADLKNASAMVYALRGAKLLTSWMDAGKNKHKITALGASELDAFKNISAVSPATQTESAHMAISDQSAIQEPAGKNTSDTKLEAKHSLDSSILADEQNQISDDLEESQDQPLQNLEIPRPAVTYDPFGEIYAELQKAQDLVKKLPRPKPAPTIQKPREKILMLTLVKNHYELINTDVGELFADMINDYQQFEKTA